MKHLLLISGFLLIFIGIGTSQTRTIRSVKREYYEGGKLHRIIRTRVTTNRYVEPQNYYKRTVLDICEYYENGNVKSRQRKIRKIGNTGRPYYELLTEEQLFNEHGIIQSSRTSKCDKQKVIYRQYDERGSLQYKSVAKPW